jgi:cathepsin F
VCLIALAGLALATAAPLAEEEYQFLFKKFIVQHKKNYATEEFFTKYQNFKANVATIQAHNAKGESWTMAVNEFADQTWEQFRAKHLGYKLRERSYLRSLNEKSLPTVNIPASVNWVTAGKVTPVKNQGQCGSCWSFSTTGSIEGAWALAGQPPVSLSEQQLVDCDHECMTYEGQNVCDSGCNGGLMPNAFRYVIATGGLETEVQYPYLAVDGTCPKTYKPFAAHISNWTAVSQDEDIIAQQMYQYGPISIAINAGPMQTYLGGIADPLFCDPNKLDHGVLIVGYGVSGTKPYWIIKNSWGTTWGEDGYYQIIRGKGKCGLNRFASRPIV